MTQAGSIEQLEPIFPLVAFLVILPLRYKGQR
jgi:hypothetical protein